MCCLISSHPKGRCIENNMKAFGHIPLASRIFRDGPCEAFVLLGERFA